MATIPSTQGMRPRLRGSKTDTAVERFPRGRPGHPVQGGARPRLRARHGASRLFARDGRGDLHLG